MLNLEKIFTPAELEEWKDTLIDWEASGTITDPDDYDEWLGELSVFERELKGEELDEETVAHWRAKLKKATAARRKQYAKEAEEIRRREEAEEKRKEELRTAFLERRGQGETVLAFSRREKVDVYETLSIATNLKKSERLAVANAREVLLEDIREQNGATAASPSSEDNSHASKRSSGSGTSPTSRPRSSWTTRRSTRASSRRRTRRSR